VKYSPSTLTQSPINRVFAQHSSSQNKLDWSQKLRHATDNLNTRYLKMHACIRIIQRHIRWEKETSTLHLWLQTSAMADTTQHNTTQHNTQAETARSQSQHLSYCFLKLWTCNTSEEYDSSAPCSEGLKCNYATRLRDCINQTSKFREKQNGAWSWAISHESFRWNSI
jgi:hypothetical protein